MLDTHHSYFSFTFPEDSVCLNVTPPPPHPLPPHTHTQSFLYWPSPTPFQWAANGPGWVTMSSDWPLIGSEVIAAPRLVFHVGYISDRRVIKAASNVSPFPLLLSWRPAGQDCTPELSKNVARVWFPPPACVCVCASWRRWLNRAPANGSFPVSTEAFWSWKT